MTPEEEEFDYKLSVALELERQCFRRLGYAHCTVCGQRVRGSGPWCDLYMQGELPCVGRCMGPQALETP